MIRKAAILAGGMGSRLASLCGGLPKPMVDLLGHPVLEYQVEALTRHGVNEIFLLTHYRSEIIQRHFGDGSLFGAVMHHVVESEPLGTAGALAGLSGLVCEPFFLIFGDVLFNMDLARLSAFHLEKGALATLVVHPSDHPQDSDLVRMNRHGEVRDFFLKPHVGDPLCNLGNAGLYVIAPEVFNHVPPGPGDLMRDVFAPLVSSGLPLAAYRTPEYLKDMGTPERFARVENDLASGRVAAFNLSQSRPAVFLDRDGTLIREVGLLHRAEDLALFPCSGPSLGRLNRSGFLAVLATNQSVVARNLCTLDGLHDIHDRMEGLLGRDGGWLDAIYACPHHPDSGYPEENAAYKLPCDCRKPADGMLRRAAADLNINLTASWMVGDSTADVLAGRNAGVRTILVRTGPGGTDGKLDVAPDYVAEDLGHAVDIILGEAP